MSFTLRCANFDAYNKNQQWIIPQDDEDNLYYMLPLHSDRVLLTTDKDQRYLLSTGSQHQLRKVIERDIRAKYERAERIIKKQLLRVKFQQLNEKAIRNQRGYFRSWRNMSEVIEEMPPKSWYMRRGAQLLFLYIWFEYQRRIKREFRRWKSFIDERRRTLRRFFDKWDCKTSRIKLNRLNARKLMTKLRPLGELVRISLLREGYNKWIWFKEWQSKLVTIRLLFRCWKTVVMAIYTAKRRLLRWGIIGLKITLGKQKLLWEDYSMKVISIIRPRISYKFFRLWMYARRRRVLLRKVLLSLLAKYIHRKYAAAWLSWKKMVGFHVISPPKSSPPKKYVRGRKVSQKATYQSGTGALVYRNVYEVTRRNNSPKLRRSQSPSKDSKIRGLSLRDRIIKRMGWLKEFETEYERDASIRRSNPDYSLLDEPFIENRSGSY